MEGSNFAGPLQSRTWNGTPIMRRSTDGYVNATAMCKANGKLWANFWQTDRCTQYLEALSTAIGFPIAGTNGLVDVQNGVGTWIHPDVATELARWISPEFSVFVNQWFRAEYESRAAAAAQPAPAPAPAPAALPAMAMLSLLKETAELFEQFGGMDERDQLLFKDLARNNLLRGAGGVALLPPVDSEDEELTISDAWLEQTGTPLPRDVAAKLGRLVAKRYREEYGVEPPKRTQYCDGAPRKVNSYKGGFLRRALEQARDLLQGNAEN